MKRHSVVLALALSAFAAMAPARADPVVLTAPGASFEILQMRPGADGKLCIVGVRAGAQAREADRGAIILFDLAANRVVWERTVEPPAGSHRVALRACHADARAVYVGAEVMPTTAADGRRVRAQVYRFDVQGKLDASAALDTGATDSFIYAIDADAGGVNVAGAATEVAADQVRNAVYFARLDAALGGAAISKLASGAYQGGSVASLLGNTLYIAGNFAPASHAFAGTIDDVAASKIVAGKYRFSLRPLKLRADTVAAAITPAHDIVLLGHAGKTTQLVGIGADGKPKENLRVASTFCWTDKISADAGTVYAIRGECGNPDAPSVLTAIDRKTGGEVVVSGVIGEPVQVLALEGELVVIARKSDGSLLLQRVKKGEELDG